MRVRIEVLGGFRVWVDGHVVPADGGWRHRRAAELVQLLALAPDHRLHRERVMAGALSGASGAADPGHRGHRHGGWDFL